jgi:flavin reductase (DIM6/NTAB) family NADH-FMN oxidoreductase RutF
MTDAKPTFTSLSRQQFREYFQPSRLVLCILPSARTESRVNIITLSFNMHCSYKPSMMAIAVQDVNRSHELIQAADEFVLSVPGESMAKVTMACGRESLADSDKVKALGLELVQSSSVGVPGLLRAIANIELRKYAAIETGDHLLVVGEVLSYNVNIDNHERPLLSVGPRTDGYKVLEHEGIHRIGVVGL